MSPRYSQHMRFVFRRSAALMIGVVLVNAACPREESRSALPVAAWVEPVVPKCSYADVLTKYDFDALKGGMYCQVCKDVDDSACLLDWPSSDGLTCALLDELRNEIFAFYGRPFQQPRWKTRFAAKTWYVASADYSDARLSPTARINVAKLATERARHASAAGPSGDTTCTSDVVR